MRQSNQDAALSFTFSSDTAETRPDFGIFVVADGMGGHQDGEKASAITARVVVSEILRKIYLPMMGDSVLQHDADRPTIAEILTEAVKQANARVLELIADAGTTVTALVVIGRLAHIAHVGDSRAYLIYKDEVEQMTRDHSLVQRLIELNQLSAEDSHTHPQRNVLYRAVGLNDAIEVDILTRRLYPGSYVLLCSDGLWGFVPEADMLQIVKSTPDPQEACRRLVNMANDRGGSDNITAILLKIPEK
ncbi:MAG: protein phosphatase 2C domain-containing protein [Anaerolineae bacterium]|nr:protein phosphatase 2C domain-containing protein [Anaerolineae bacterium]